MGAVDLSAVFLKQWTTLIEKSRESLDYDDLERVEEIKPWDDLQKLIYDSEVLSTARIQSELDDFRIFVEFFETKLETKLDTTFLWATLTHLLQLVDDDPNRLGWIPAMIKPLTQKAAAFNRYCKNTQVVGNTVKEACFDMQVLFVNFFTDSINGLHAAGEGKKLQDRFPPGQESMSLKQLIEHYHKTTKDGLNEALKRIEDLALTNLPMPVQPGPPTDTNRIPSRPRCLMLPHTKTFRFFDRVSVFEKLDCILGPTSEEPSFQSVALYGLRGVGKSTVASTYVEKVFKENNYDVILWVRGENASSMRQSFTEIAMRLKLYKAHPQTHDENLILVQDWFQSTDCRWLVVYDNVESFDTLMAFWPGPGQGKAIITTQNRSLASKLASRPLEVPSWDTKMGSKFLLFLLEKSIGRDLQAESNSALNLSERMSGHALALAQVATLIRNGESTIEEFETIYKENAYRVHSLNELAAPWELSFQKLDKNSLSLLGIISFLVPDDIPQKLFEKGLYDESSSDFNFCSDKFLLLAALTRLITMNLIKKDRDTRILSIHRIVQTQFKYFLSLEQRQKTFDATVSLVYNVLPKPDTSKGQLYEEWEIYNQYLPHVLNLKNCFSEEIERTNVFKASWEFCELLIQFQRYLYEIHQLADLKSLCDVNLAAVTSLEDGPRKNDLQATIMSHQANLAESWGDVKSAIELNNKVYTIRLEEDPRKQDLLCQVANNLGYCHNTANDHRTALVWFERSLDWWEESAKREKDPPHFKLVTLVNMARCKLYLDKAEEAREILDSAIPQLKKAKPSQWAMLAFAYFVLGKLERRQRNFQTAEEHFLKAHNSWVEGDRKRAHPFVGGCMYKIGACCLDQGKVQAAIKNINDSIVVTKFHRNNMPVEHARNLFKLSEALLQDSDNNSLEKAEDNRKEAETYLKSRQSDMIPCDTEAAYDNLIPIFWR
ncbi:pfs domain-containing protein [Talaromyces proteolyticus]|uniref:Pfs domain-containing protein n=1 Tax=Talaromyces proteolyticus TaxID=1131652 RepID=A0AAD4L3P4_9EURO|nr:pfs domain-containing protein [Talaromyces proteolyticus]KAH8703633.1 pfs domain-containing protein [Talaromyces proteolyticus]